MFHCFGLTTRDEAEPGTTVNSRAPDWKLLQPGRHGHCGLPQAMTRCLAVTVKQFPTPQTARWTAHLRERQGVVMQTGRQLNLHHIRFTVSEAGNLILFPIICQRLKACR